MDFASDNHDGSISLFVLGTSEQSSFDNLAFVNPETLIVGEDRGDTLHKQLNVLDSIWVYDVRRNDPNPRRLLALGRDTESEADAILLDASTPGFQNEGDNEVTGVQVSDGAPTIQGLLGKPQNPVLSRWFFTQQHGKNTVYQIVPRLPERNGSTRVLEKVGMEQVGTAHDPDVGEVWHWSLPRPDYRKT